MKRQWNVQQDGEPLTVLDIAADAKGAKGDSVKTFLALEKGRVARWDTGTPGGVVQDVTRANGKEYNSLREKFTCMAPSGDGHVAVGTDGGEIKLFKGDGTLTRANKVIPSLGQRAITAIDVSFNSRYIVATTDNFLIVMQTFQHSGNDLKSGFKDEVALPFPKLLKLKPEHRIMVVCHGSIC